MKILKKVIEFQDGIFMGFNPQLYPLVQLGLYLIH